jgi:hypothetical protein
MPEILTESFCERCGTRYTFESAGPTKARRLGRFKTLSKGLKNYVMSDDTSLDEALAAARNDDERELTAQQLDAFHATFNFCMTCRQYTCGNCWNQAEGRCLTCAPHLGHEIMPAPFPDMPQLATDHVQFDASAWPTTDLATEHGNGAALADPSTDELEPEFDLSARLAQFAGERNGDAHVVEEPAGAAETGPVAELAADDVAPPDWVLPRNVAPATEDEPGTDFASTAPETPVADDLAFDQPSEVEFQEAAPTPAAEAEFEAATPTLAAEPEFEAAAPTLAAEDEPVVAEAPAAESVVAASPTPEAPSAGPEMVASDEVAPVSIDDRAAAAERQTSSLLAKFRPGQNIDAELDAFEASLADEPDAAVDHAAEQEPAIDAAAAAVEAAPEPEPEPVAFDVPAPAEPVPAAEFQPEPIAAQAARAPEPEPVVADAPAGPEPEPVVGAVPPAAEAEPEPIAVAPPAAESEPEPIAAEPEPEPEPIAAEPERVAASATVEPEPEPEAARSDVVEQPTWRITAPDPIVPPVIPPAAPPTPPPPPAQAHVPPAASAQPASPPDATSDPQWPATPQWPGASADVSFLAERVAARSAATDALWAASARDVVAQTPASVVGGVQPCANCGLSLSATARFCRRCGSRQGA